MVAPSPCLDCVTITRAGDLEDIPELVKQASIVLTFVVRVCVMLSWLIFVTKQIGSLSNNNPRTYCDWHLDIQTCYIAQSYVLWYNRQFVHYENKAKRLEQQLGRVRDYRTGVWEST
jgi:hypothetical protein